MRIKEIKDLKIQQMAESYFTFPSPEEVYYHLNKETMTHPPILNEQKIKTRIYLAGKITGLDLEDAITKFKEASAKLRAEGYEPIYTMEHYPYQKFKNWKWSDWMRASLKLLLSCHELAALPSHMESKGALLELITAKELGMPIKYLQL